MVYVAISSSTPIIIFSNVIIHLDEKSSALVSQLFEILLTNDLVFWLLYCPPWLYSRPCHCQYSEGFHNCSYKHSTPHTPLIISYFIMQQIYLYYLSVQGVINIVPQSTCSGNLNLRVKTRVTLCQSIVVLAWILLIVLLYFLANAYSKTTALIAKVSKI